MFLVYVSYWYLIDDLKESGKGFANKKINSLRSLERASEDENDKKLQLKVRYFSTTRPFVTSWKGPKFRVHLHFYNTNEILSTRQSVSPFIPVNC